MNDGEPMAHLERLEGLSPGLREVLREKARVMQVPRGTVVFTPGRRPESMLLVLEGRVRVYQVSEAGREIVLYRVEAGESCVLTTACLLGEQPYSAEAVAETDSIAAAIPRGQFEALLETDAVFRRFVFESCSQRITGLFLLVEEVAFGRIDVRLADRLLLLARGETEVRVTHQQLAVELGSAREVITRQLDEFQRRGWIALSRGRIEILAPGALENLRRSG